MFFVDTIEVAGLGNRSYLAGGARTAVAVDPPRDVELVIAAAARRGVRISQVVETHLHNDYVSGGLELARLTGADYLVPAGARVYFERVPVTDGDRAEIDAALAALDRDSRAAVTHALPALFQLAERLSESGEGGAAA